MLAINPPGLVESFPPVVHIHLLVMLGDALEGQGDWANARHFDKEAMALWGAIDPEKKSAGAVLSAMRREGIEWIREGKAELAADKMADVHLFYIYAFQDSGINFMRFWLPWIRSRCGLRHVSFFLVEDRTNVLWRL